jgi:simple sugar transport system permease protein
MGAPIRRTIAPVYGLGGFYGAVAGVLYAFYTGSDDPLAPAGVGFVAGALFEG